MLWTQAPDGEKLYFESCGKFVSRGEWIHPCRVIGSYEIIVILSGKVYLRVGEEEFAAEKNDILLLPPEMEHSGTRQSRGVSFYWLHFRMHADFCNRHFRFAEGDIAPLLSLFRILLHDVNTPFYPQSSAEYLTRLILNEISYLSDRNNDKSALTRKIADYIASDISVRPTVSEIAAHFGYNADYISRRFRHAYGQSIGAYIADQTVKRAKELLSEKEKSVAAIARELGFESSNAFTNFFKYHEGITPSRYASIYYNTHINHS